MDAIWLVLVGRPAAFRWWRNRWLKRFLRECRDGKRGAEAMLSETGLPR